MWNNRIVNYLYNVNIYLTKELGSHKWVHTNTVRLIDYLSWFTFMILRIISVFVAAIGKLVRNNTIALYILCFNLSHFIVSIRKKNTNCLVRMLILTPGRPHITFPIWKCACCCILCFITPYIHRYTHWITALLLYGCGRLKWSFLVFFFFIIVCLWQADRSMTRSIWFYRDSTLVFWRFVS